MYFLSRLISQIPLIIIILVLISISIPITIFNYAFAYVQKTVVRPASATKVKTIASNATIVAPTIKIISPNNGQKVPAANNRLVISGSSSDNILKDCGISVIINGLKPYQKAAATGINGTYDYSIWTYKLNPLYTTIKEGPNKITGKITCISGPNKLTKWTSVNVTGIRDNRVIPVTTTMPTPQPQKQMLQLDSSQNRSIRPTNLSQSGNGNYNVPHIYSPITPAVTKSQEPLQISVGVDKNPITAGNIQTITITVHSSDIANTAITGAKVSGQVINLTSSSSYPSNNLGSITEQFGGITNTSGRLSYSWKTLDAAKIDTIYGVKVDVSYNMYNAKSELITFTVKPSSNYNDNDFILAQANSKFTDGLTGDMKKFTEGVLDKVRKSIENNLR